jgi:acetyl esterase/lipase
MTLTTLQVGAAVTPTVIRTGVAHYTQRKPRHKKPTAHISYDEGLNLIRRFLSYASHKTVEDLQSFTAQWVPHASWVRTENVKIPEEQVNRAAQVLIQQFGEAGIQQIGGQHWWQWRRKNSELKAEWIEMRTNYNELKAANKRSKRVMVYMHGGGYFFGSVDEHRYQLQRHARKLKARVIAPRYRLAPQFPFPCGVQDCLAVYLYLLTIHQPNEIILAGDSAGGGMVFTLMCILRDQGIPLPAGGILISPWVDLSHSFPSVAADNPMDYIPSHGFHQKPSISWPPPNDDEEAALADLPSISDREQAFIDKTNELAQKLGKSEPGRQGDEVGIEKTASKASRRAAGPGHQLSVRIDGELVTLKEQFQMYTTNEMIAHPLVSPALQPSLGGLPPLLILTGGGEMLRDEQIYVAHKAAHPANYPLGDPYRSRYDPDDAILKKYKPTPVQLQVWEDLCHVAPTLSFTRPAKYMYRSVAQFGAWALARAQSTAIDIVDDDEISVISSDSRSETDSMDSIAAQKNKQSSKPAIVGRAGDPIPAFQNHMIRQRIDRYGNIYDLAPASELPATTMDPNEIGILKTVPVKKWLDAKKQWDTKYASIKKRVQRQRLQNRANALPLSFGPDENPPPTALAGRRTAKEEMPPKLRKGHLLAMWSGWGSRHDEHTIQREEKALYDEKKQEQQAQKQKEKEDDLESAVTTDDKELEGVSTVPTTASRSRRRSSGRKKQQPAIDDRNRSRRRTISVTDEGQVEGAPRIPSRSLPISTTIPSIDDVSNSTSSSQVAQADETTFSTPPGTSATYHSQYLNPAFIPKFKTAAHLRHESQAGSDAASMRSKASFADNASTMAVFGAPGVSKVTSLEREQDQRPASSATSETVHSDKASTIRSPMTGKNAVDGDDTPVSRRSMERLQSHQIGDGATHSDATSTMSADKLNTLATRLEPLRSPSSTAMVRAEGVVGVVKGGEADTDVHEHDGFDGGRDMKGTDTNRQGLGPVVVNGNGDEKETAKTRPGVYDRADSEFQTALEVQR